MRIGRWTAPLLFGLLCWANAGAEIVEETGSLQGFMGGVEPAAAYDNWISHVVEGISDPGYNDYGPSWVDPQTTGFGNYRLIPDTPAGDATVMHWRSVLDQFLGGDLLATDALLDDSAATFRYETVRFTDTDFGRVFWMLREQLDDSFVDDFGTPGDPDDDVVGSFRNGWGLFLVNPTATRPNLHIQVVHPTDDYFAPFAAVALFLRLDAGALSINGTGREVMWTGVGDYANGKSLADPSRYPRHPVQFFHEAFVDRFDADYPGQAQVIQVHSFDASWDLNTANIMSAGYYLRTPTLPLRDLRREGKDIVHMTQHPVFEAGDWVGDSGALGTLPVNSYYAINSDEPFYVYTSPDDSLLVPQATNLRADPNNQQVATYLDHSHYMEGQAVDPFMHVEMDEYPGYLDNGNYPLDELINLTSLPPTFATYAPMFTFYDPFFTAVENWYAWMDSPTSGTMPPQVPGLEVDSGEDGTVRVRWPQERDGQHLTYEIVAAETPPTPDSPVVWDVSNDPALRVIGYDDWTTVTTLPVGQSYYVATRIRDLAGNAGPLSISLPVNVMDSEGVDVEIESFETFPVAGWPMWLSCRPVHDDVASIKAVWRLNEGEPDTLDLEWVAQSSSGVWAVQLPDDTPVSPTDLLEWKLLTQDQSVTGNPLSFPETGWYESLLTNGTSRLQPFDFETPSNALILEGDWSRGIPTSGPGNAVSGENVLATRLDGPYQTGTPSHAFVENAVRPEYGPLLLVYEQWVDYDVVDDQPGFAHDGGRLRIDGVEFDDIAPLGGYTHRIFEGPGEESRSVFSGTSTGWETVVVDLHDYYGFAGYLEFSSESDGQTGHDGWYIDDIRLTREVNLLPPEPFTLVSPEDDGAITGATVDFTWEPVVDDDPYAMPIYTLELTSADSLMFFEAGSETTITVDFDLLDLGMNGPPFFTWRVLADSQGDSLWSTDTFLLNNPISAADEDDDAVPTEFALREVWPNPFNSTINVQVDLPVRSGVRVSLHNILGQQVADWTQPVAGVGSHRLAFQANGLASGVYLLRVEAAGQNALRKVVLVK